MDMIQGNHKIVMRLHKSIELLQGEYQKHKALNDHEGCKSLEKRLSVLRYVRDGE